MQTYKERHKKRNYKTIEKKDVLINIDYLILNFEGAPFGDFPENSDFKAVHFDYGTKIFENRSEIFYKNEKIGQMMCKPRASIMDENLAQFQLENHLFYTKSLKEIENIIVEYTDETKYTYKSINRLDIALDSQDKNNTYRTLFDSLMAGSMLISGRKKNIQAYFETYKGKSVLNGMQVGKRTSDRLLRIYNKSLSLQLTEKPYINEFYKNNSFVNENVWRFEFQLNSSFFRFLKQYAQTKKQTEQDMTWGIFSVAGLFELLKIATKGFFEIHENTGKSQINKEKKISIFDYDALCKKATNQTVIFKKLKKTMLSNTTIKKRLAKSLFREYYSNDQDISYIIALNMVLQSQDMTNDKKLSLWFKNKIHFYLHEFKTKEKIIKQFAHELFNEHCNLFLDTLFTEYSTILN